MAFELGMEGSAGFRKQIICKNIEKQNKGTIRAEQEAGPCRAPCVSDTCMNKSCAC